MPLSIVLRCRSPYAAASARRKDEPRAGGEIWHQPAHRARAARLRRDRRACYLGWRVGAMRRRARRRNLPSGCGRCGSRRACKISARTFSTRGITTRKPFVVADFRLFQYMHLAGFEPTTLGFEDRCSIQLSYRCFYRCTLTTPRSSNNPKTCQIRHDRPCRTKSPEKFGHTSRRTYPDYKAAVSAAAGSGASTHLPCSRMRSWSRSTASDSGMLNFTGVFPT